MASGSFRRQIQFQRESTIAESPDYGNVTDGTWTDLFGGPYRGQLIPLTGTERLQADATASSVTHTLKVRSSADTRTLTAADRASIDGVLFQIRWIANRDQKNRYLSMHVEEGVNQ